MNKERRYAIKSITKTLNYIDSKICNMLIKYDDYIILDQNAYNEVKKVVDQCIPILEMAISDLMDVREEEEKVYLNVPDNFHDCDIPSDMEFAINNMKSVQTDIIKLVAKMKHLFKNNENKILDGLSSINYDLEDIILDLDDCI